MKIWFCTIQLLLLMIACSAQSVPPNAKDILTSKGWKIDGFGTETVYKIKFTDTAIIVHLNGELIGELEYYFSTTLNDCSPDGFNENNVGVSLGGKYLISEKSCLELINVSPNELKFKSVYGGNPTTVTIASPF